jgi:hypothetical protein
MVWAAEEYIAGRTAMVSLRGRRKGEKDSEQAGEIKKEKAEHTRSMLVDQPSEFNLRLQRNEDRL